MGDMLRTLEDRSKWCSEIDRLVDVYNKTIIETMGMSPFEKRFGKEPEPRVLLPVNDFGKSSAGIAKDRRTEKAEKNLKERMLKTVKLSIGVGEKVYYKMPLNMSEVTKYGKLSRMFIGPFEVTAIFDDGTVEIAKLFNKRPSVHRRVSVRRLKKSDHNLAVGK